MNTGSCNKGVDDTIHMDYNMLILGCEFVVFVIFFVLFASAANDIAYPFWTQLVYLLVAIIGMFLTLVPIAFPVFPYTDYRRIRYVIAQVVMALVVLLVIVAYVLARVV